MTDNENEELIRKQAYGLVIYIAEYDTSELRSIDDIMNVLNRIKREAKPRPRW